MRKSILTLSVLSALALPNVVMAEEAAAPAAEAAKEPESSWSLTTNIGFVSDYYFRGISQSWHKPTVQGGIDLAHSSGFYVGVWGSGISNNTYPEATTEIDLYAGYNGSIKAVDGLGYTVGLYGYFYPGGNWDKYTIGGVQQTPDGGRWDTVEANFGLSYKWLSAKASVTLTDWFGAERKTGWDGGTSGSTYLELNAAYPLPWWNLTLIGHVGHLDVNGKLDTTNPASTSGTMEDNPDFTDYKVGISKAFKIFNADGWNAGIYYVGASNEDYWGSRGYGGSSFSSSTETKELNDDRFVVTINRTF